ncbi:MAG: hypothetical protein JSS01_00190 [Proteobacteria bacterium]|nr:hypothetical protein [Pseudomonadota bacterium]
MVWLVGKACGARTVAYLHGLDITAPHLTHQNLRAPTLKGPDHAIVHACRGGIWLR